VDPYFADNPAASCSADAVSPDFILVTHGHGDHVGDLMKVARRTGALVIANFEICNWVSGKGHGRVHAQHIGGGFEHPFGHVKLTPALHGSVLPDGSDGGMAAGFLLRLGGKRVYLAGDTGLFSDMQLIGREGLDLAVLPIGDNYTMGPDDALQAVKFLNPEVVIPIHYNTWEAITQDVQKWAARVQAETGARPIVLSPGESYTI
jgi:L-ascorbate metabolism protein UlaG (beta-lactamase superfamily)